MEHGTDILQAILLLLVLSVGAVAAFRVFSLPPILGYLMVGAITSEHALGWLPENHSVEFMGEVGVVFLLFAIGLEFSVKQLMAMRRTVLGLGGAQVIGSTLAGMGVLILFDWGWQSALVAAGAMALSSTAIVVKQLTDQSEMRVEHGQLSLGILLFQDLAVVPFLIMIPLLAAGHSTAEEASTLGLVLEGLISMGVLAVALLVGHYALRPLFHKVAQAQSVELFNITILLVALTAAWITQSLGLSLALGAFIAGMMLSETEYRHQIESEIRPFRDILLGLFFITVGAKLDFSVIPSLWLPILLLVIGLTIGKALLIAFTARFFGAQNGPALRTGLVLAQGGEFGFALLALALSNHVMVGNEAQIVLAAIVISMAVAPIIIRYNDTITKKLFAETYLKQRYKAAHEFSLEVKEVEDHVIICGYRRAGQSLGRFLRDQDIDYIALDLDSKIIQEAWEAGESVYYADATRPEVLIAAGLYRARMVVITVTDMESAHLITEVARNKAADIPIVVRTYDDSDMESLEALGATEVLPETLEATLMITERVLHRLDVPAADIMQVTEQIRADNYRPLQSFFHGEQKKIKQRTNVESFLHTVLLDDDDYAIRKSIRELELENLEVTIKSIRRSGIRGENPNLDTVLKSQDILILEGAKDNFTDAENIIKSGKAPKRLLKDKKASSAESEEVSVTET